MVCAVLILRFSIYQDVTAGTQLAAPTVEVAVASPASVRRLDPLFFPIKNYIKLVFCFVLQAAIDSRLEFCIASPIMTPSSGTHTCAEVVRRYSWCPFAF